MELAVAFITGVVGPLIYLIIEKYKNKERKRCVDTVVEAVADSILVEDELSEIREIFNSDRAWISQFHNGGNFYPTGKSIQKFSIFYEVTRVGVSTLSHIFSNIPCSLYSRAFTHMLDDEKKGIFIADFANKKINTYGLYTAAESVGTKSTYVIPMFSLEEKLVGTIGIDYVGKKRKLTKDEWEHLQIRAGRIGGYLSSYLEK